MKKIFTLSLLIFISAKVHSQNHLLLSEIAATPDSGEFIEIYNPTLSAVSLDDYYLADNSEYAVLPSGTINVGSSDFIVRFPAGQFIQSGAVLVVALRGGVFIPYYNVTPDFEIISQDPNVTDMILLSTSNSPTITNSGEGIILFYWDGNSDLVSDVDLMNMGVPSAANQIATKTGLTVDGPDTDVIPGQYLNDALTIPLQSSAPGIGTSTKRILLEGTNETHSGGNGITGDDETTENTAITWDNTFTAATPGVPDVVTGINNLSDPDFSIYPNPSHDYFTVYATGNYQNLELKIYDVTGKLVREKNISSITTTVNHNLNPGVYFIRIMDDNVVSTTELVVE